MIAFHRALSVLGVLYVLFCLIGTSLVVLCWPLLWILGAILAHLHIGPTITPGGV